MAATLDFSDIIDFYDNKSVLITGVTGFIGKVLLEKLLYSCRGINYAYVLIRPKKNQTNSSSDGRFEELIKSKVFSRIKEECPSVMSKIVPVWGDLSSPGLGITEETLNAILENVSVVLHCAATVKFNEPLKIALEINLIGTKNVMEIFKKLKSQMAFVHLSTAYANCHRDKIEEVIYPSPVPPRFLLEAHECLNEKEMDCLTNVISEGRPNTYTLTKAIAESYLSEYASGLPVAIVRPSIVGNAINEPERGWGDSFAILSGISYAVGLGLVRNLPVNCQARLDVIPVDMVCSLMIAVAWHTSKTWPKNKTFPVYNFVSGTKNPITFQEYIDMGLAYVRTIPPISIVNYPSLSFTRNPILLFFGIFLNHYLPAILMDLIRVFKGKNAKYFKIYRRFFSSLPLKTFFMEREFNFQYESCMALYRDLSPRDQTTFNFDIQSLNWPTYLENMFEGFKDFLLPPYERTVDVAVARKKLHRLHVRSVVFDVVFVLAIPLLLYFFVLSPCYNMFTIEL